jgi:hypothetical protein
LLIKKQDYGGINMLKQLYAPRGRFSTEDAATKKRKELADRLKKGQDVNVTGTGEVVAPNDPKAEQGTTLHAPDGKLA